MNMTYNIRVLLAVALTIVVSSFSSLFAQTAIINSGSFCNLSTAQELTLNSNTGWVNFISLQLYIVEDDFTFVSIEDFDNILEKVIRYKKLKNLYLNPSKIPEEYLNKSFRAVVNLSGGLTYWHTFDVVSLPSLINTITSAAQFDNEYCFGVCKGDPVDITLGNPAELVETPYSGNKYTYSFDWKKRTSSGLMQDEAYYATGLSIHDETLTSLTHSETYGFEVFNTIYNGTTPIDGCVSRSIGKYFVQYDEPLEITTKLNGNEGVVSDASVAFNVCDKTDVNLSFESLKDDVEYSDVEYSLYSVVSGVRTLVGTFTNNIDLGVLSVVDKKNTTYNYELEAVDLIENGNRCVTNQSIAITVLEMDADITITQNAPLNLCEGQSVTLNANVSGTSTYELQWSSANGITSDNTTNNNLVDNNVVANGGDAYFGTKDYRVTLTQNGLCTIYKDFTVQVNKRPILTPSPDVTVCKNKSVTIGVLSNQNTIESYTWTPDEGTKNADGSERQFLAQSTKTYGIYAINDKGCQSETKNITVTVNELPKLSNVVALPSTICKGEETSVTVTLDNASDYTNGQVEFTWTITTDGEAPKTQKTKNPTYSINISPVANTTISVVAADINGCESSDAVTTAIVVNELPEFNPTATVGCDGEQFVISANPVDGAVYNYVYTPLDGAIAGAPSGAVYTVNLPLANLTAPVVYKYNVTARSALNCEATKQVDVTVYPLPNISVDKNSVTVCIGQEFTFKAASTTPNVVFDWSGAATGVGSTLTTSISVEGVHTITVNATDLNGCSKSIDVVATVVALPILPVITPAAVDICKGSTTPVTLSVVSPDATKYNYVWSNGDEGVSINVLPTVTTSYVVKAIDKVTLCESENSFPATITVHPLPTISEITGDKEICIGQSTTLSVSPVDGVIYHWSTLENTNSITVSPVVNTTYTIYLEDEISHCISDTKTITVIVNQLPVITSLNLQPNVCKDDNVVASVTLATEGTYKYEWTLDGVPTGITTKTYNVNTSTVGTYTIGVKIKDSKGCFSEEKTAVVTVNEIPDFTPTISPDEICNGGSFEIKANVSTADFSIEWLPIGTSPTGVAAGDSYTVSDVLVTEETTLSYNIKVENKLTLCSTIKTVSVVVKPALDLTLVSSEVAVCKGSTVKLTANSPIADLTYSWDDDATITTPIRDILFDTVGDFTYKVTATNGVCTETKSITIKVNSIPDVPVINVDRSTIYKGEPVQLTIENFDATNVYTLLPNNIILTSNTITLFPESNIDYSVSVKSALDCNSISEPTSVIVNPVHAVSISADRTLPICPNTDITLTADVIGEGTFSYLWDDDDASTTQTITVKSTTSRTFNVTVTSEKGCSVTSSFLVEIAVVPEINFTPSTPSICNGNSAVVTVSSPLDPEVAYSWRYYDGASLKPWGTNASSPTQTLSPSVTTTYNVKAAMKVGAVCFSTAEFTLTVNSLPEIDIVGDSIVCEGSDLSLTATTPGFDYKWFKNDVEVSNNGTLNVNHIDQSQDGDYVLQVTDAVSGCQDNLHVNVVVNPLPIPVLLAGVKISYCFGESVEFAVSDVYADYLWTDASDNVVSTSNIATVVNPLTSSYLNLVVTDVNGCVSSVTRFDYTINSLPTVEVEDQIICSGDAYLATPTITGSVVDYEWSFNSAVISTEPQLSIDPITAANSGLYSVIVKDDNGCSSAADEFMIDVKTSVLNIDSQDKICKNSISSLLFSANVVGDETSLTSYVFDVYDAANVLLTSSTETAPNFTLDISTYGIGVYSVVVTGETPNGCKLMSIKNFEILDAPNPVVEIDKSDYCEDDDITITVTGGEKYVASATRDGETLTLDQTEFNTAAAVLNLKYDYIENGKDFNEYIFNFDVYVGDCVDHISQTVNVYKSPVSDLTITPVSPVISGTDVTLSVNAGYDNYIFRINDNEEYNGINNSFTFNVLNYSGIEVTIESFYAVPSLTCSLTRYDEIKVLDKINVLPVVASNDSYCAGEDGVDIEVLNTDSGIVYHLVGAYGLPNLKSESDGDNIIWHNVKIGDTNPTIFKVEGYYEDLPLERTEMLNSVSVTEVSLPNIYNMTPVGTVTTCDATALSVDNSDVDTYYSLLLDGNVVRGDVQGTGGELVLGTSDSAGKYTVTANKKFNGNDVCSVEMNGSYVVNVPTATQFNIVSDPLNGNYCEDVAGVTIGLDGSEVGATYYISLNGVDIEKDGAPLTIEGNGAPINFDVTFDTDGVYTVYCILAGCKSHMLGSVDVHKFVKPVDFKLSASNGGHFCDGSEGVTITVESQQDGYFYDLFLNGASVEQITGNASGTSLNFSPVNVEGVYTVVVSIPEVDCSRVLSGVITIVKDKLPIEQILAFDKATICEGEVANLQLLGSENNVLYKLYRDGDVFVDELPGNGGLLSFDNLGVGGIYSIIASNTFTNCEFSFENNIKLTVVPRPNVTSPTVYIETPADKEECYGVDIVVKDAEIGMIYKLYRKSDDSEDRVIVAGKQIIIAVGDVNADRFTDIRDKSGHYFVSVSNGFCEDYLPDDILVESLKYPNIVNVYSSGNICSGDPAATISISSVEGGVVYTLVRIENDGSETILETKPFDSDDVNGYTFESKLDRTATYIVRANLKDNDCIIDMLPHINFVVNPLPVSYQLVGSGIYCDDEGAEISLSGSELNYTYVLMYGPDGFEVPVKTITGTGVVGSEISFGKFKDEGRYVALARSNTLCTSSMLGEIEVSKKPEIEVPTLDKDTYTFCSTDLGASIKIQNPIAGVVYSLYNESDELVFNVEALNSDPIEFVVSNEGTFKLYGSYFGTDCVLFLHTILVQKLNAPTLLDIISSADNSCDFPVSIGIASSEVGVTYKLYSEGVFIGDILGDGSPISWELAETSGSKTYSVIADNNGCTTDFGTKSISFDNKAGVVLDIYVDGEISTVTDLCSISYLIATPIVGSDAPAKFSFYVNDELKETNSTGIFIPTLVDGSYTIKVVMTSVKGCEVDASKMINYVSSSFNVYNVSSISGCSDDVAVVLLGSEVGVTYSLSSDFDLTGHVESTTIVGDGNQLKWVISNVEGRHTYYVHASNAGVCEKLMGQISLNNDKVDIDLKLDMYLGGVLFTGNTICKNSNLYIVSYPKINSGSVSIDYFEYYIDSVFVGKNTSGLYVPSFAVGEHQFMVKFFTTSGCEYSESVDLTVKDVESADVTLRTPDGITVYCADEKGIRFYIQNSKPGYTYMLFKESYSPSDELVDMWEGNGGELWFNGWDESNGKAYAKAGTYYLLIQGGTSGCVEQTESVVLIENPLPEEYPLFYAIEKITEIGDKSYDETTRNDSYGLLDVGGLFLENSDYGITYNLYHEDTDAVVASKKGNGGLLYFGNIRSKVDTVPSTLLWGEGAYSIQAVNDSTGCSSNMGYVQFVEEQLVAYDVYLYMNSSQSATAQLLFPTYPNKGNHKYIDWSTKVDKVYAPKTTTDAMGSISVSDDGTDIYENGSGYTSIKGNANIVYELLQTYKPVITYDTVYNTVLVDTTFIVRDSVLLDDGSYDITETEKTESIEKVVSSVEERVVQEPITLFGNYGFDNYDGSDYTLAGLTGYFRYAKRASFYGKEVIPYRIYNKDFKNARFSNAANITILCGNESTGADSSSVFLIPNAFSPNGDGFNDNFKILLPSDYEQYSESKLEVFNRWGTLVYRSSGNQYGKDCDWWDGNSKSSNMLTAGTKLPSGTYFYVFTVTFVDAHKASKSTKKMSGYVELRR